MDLAGSTIRQAVAHLALAFSPIRKAPGSGAGTLRGESGVLVRLGREEGRIGR